MEPGPHQYFELPCTMQGGATRTSNKNSCIMALSIDLKNQRLSDIGCESDGIEVGFHRKYTNRMASESDDIGN
jgi:hypothetical protein